MLTTFFNNRSVAILGFGREGESTLTFLEENYSGLNILISDREEKHNPLFEKSNHHLTFSFGEAYLEAISEYDIIIKSPGISLNGIDISAYKERISSQTELFIQAYGSQIIGVTGTKGKSTTASLIHHILQSNGFSTLLVGNIGTPCFDAIQQIESQTKIVTELSCHQLEYCRYSPKIAVLLNIFPEHLDHYKTYEKYYTAKLNIAKYQQENDTLIVDCNNTTIAETEHMWQGLQRTIPIEKNRCGYFTIKDQNLYFESQLVGNLSAWKLKGAHNSSNLLVALQVCTLVGCEPKQAYNSALNFNGLPHRLEYVGYFNAHHYYNDSIATIPEATLLALESIGTVDTLLLGGFDRGLDYSKLLNFLNLNSSITPIFFGAAGERMAEGVTSHKSLNIFSDFEEAIACAQAVTKATGTILLSPAAASYDQFHNFEHRGNCFKKKAEGL